MDAGRIWLASTIATVCFAIALIAPKSSEAAGQSGWTGAAPPPAAPTYTSPPSYTQPSYAQPSYAQPSYAQPADPAANNTAPNYGAPSYDRYGAPATGTQPVYGQPATISQRTQNAVTGTAGALRDGFGASVQAAKNGTQAVGQQFSDWGNSASQQMRAAGSAVQSTASQALGTNTSQPRYTNPFTAPAAAPPTNTSARTQPPPWPNASAPAATTSPVAAAPTSAWPASSTTSATQPFVAPNGNWSSIGSTMAAPPMPIPGSSSSSSSNADSIFNLDAPITTVVGRTETTSAFDPPPRQDNTHSVLAPSSQPPTNARPANDDWTWGNSANASAATIGRNGTQPRSDSTRDTNVTPIASAPQENRRAARNKTEDLWADDPWGKPASSPTITSGGPAAVTAPSISAGNNSMPRQSQPGTNIASAPQSPFPATATSPMLNAPMNGSQPNNMNFASAQNPAQPNAAAPAQPNAGQPAAPPQEKPWMLMAAAVIGLAGSLAGNFFLGWSYLDARQKYESLVRRTADTFRRTKQAAA